MKFSVFAICILFSISSVNAQITRVQLSGRYKTDTLTDTGRYIKRPNEKIIISDLQGSYLVGQLNKIKVYFKAEDVDNIRDLKLWMDNKMANLENDLENAKLNLNISKYGKKYAKDIMDSKIRLGQPSKVVLAILGEPTEKHSEVSRGLIKEKWIYTNSENSKSAYCYFTNGLLTKYGD